MQNTILSARPAASARTARISTAGRIFIAVFLVVVFEGAIRKWGFRSATIPLVLLRDLLALYAIARFAPSVMRRQRHIVSILLVWSCCVFGWGLLQLVLGESNFGIFFIGVRFWLLYIAFAVIIAAVMTERDYEVSLRVLLATLVLMTPLAVVQHFSPPGSFINAGLEDNEEDIFVVVAGIVRTTGTFSFTAGFVIFLALCTPFAIGIFEARKRNFRQWIVALGIFASLVISCVVSGARSAFIFSGGLLMVYLFANLLFAPVRRKGSALLMVVVILAVVVGLASVFHGAIEATQERFQTAAEDEDLVARMLSVIFGESGAYEHVTWHGIGIGMGSNLAQYVQSGQRRIFVLAEAESGRALVEGGLLGWLYLALKFAVVVGGLLAALKRAARSHQVFPLLVWVGLAVAAAGWPFIGQLTANALFGVYLAFGLLVLRYPTVKVFK
ncbi:hypothetical protein QTI66_32990 [Variovorax sp. J22R133]|uniref:hypothetical protein n=1 Tax=Variovorax brevis TaxID=3053503 RepID=UPI00257498BD|nr:hypothetical protein [Variovorax sp. J22R133]MDM0116946.1 hypothetical protein [Variovorax sp. J22R133]